MLVHMVLLLFFRSWTRTSTIRVAYQKRAWKSAKRTLCSHTEAKLLDASTEQVSSENLGYKCKVLCLSFFKKNKKIHWTVIELCFIRCKNLVVCILTFVILVFSCRFRVRFISVIMQLCLPIISAFPF